MDRFSRYCPLVQRTELQDLDREQPETYGIPLPSFFSGSDRARLELDELGRLEYDLRTGQCYGALSQARQGIKRLAINLKQKNDNVRGGKQMTCAQEFLRGLHKAIERSGKLYTVGRRALLSLGLSTDDQVFCELRPGDLTMKNPFQLKGMGEGKQVNSWIWTVGQPASLTPQEAEEWSIEGLCIVLVVFFV